MEKPRNSRGDDHTYEDAGFSKTHRECIGMVEHSIHLGQQHIYMGMRVRMDTNFIMRVTWIDWDREWYLALHGEELGRGFKHLCGY